MSFEKFSEFDKIHNRDVNIYPKILSHEEIVIYQEVSKNDFYDKTCVDYNEYFSPVTHYLQSLKYSENVLSDEDITHIPEIDVLPSKIQDWRNEINICEGTSPINDDFDCLKELNKNRS